MLFGAPTLPQHQVVETCRCGAKLTARSPSSALVSAQARGFREAHELCRRTRPSAKSHAEPAPAAS